MSQNSSGRTFAQILKTLLITALRLIGIAIAFACKVIALILNKISELLDHASHGSH